MKEEHKTRIMSQQQSHLHRKLSKDAPPNLQRLSKAPSFHQPSTHLRHQPIKNQHISLNRDKGSVIDMKTNKEIGRSVPNELQSPLRLLQKKLSGHKLKAVSYSSVKGQSAKLQFEEDDILKVQMRGRLLERAKKHRQKKIVIYFTKGNNHRILSEIFVDRFGFKQTQVKQQANMCWLQSIGQKDMGFQSYKSSIDDRLPEINKFKLYTSSTIYNYLEGESQLTNKQKLFKNMRKCYPESIGNYIPKSFIIDFRQDQSLVVESLLQFINYYFKKEGKVKKIKSLSIKNFFVDISIPAKHLAKIMEESQLSMHQNNEENDSPSQMCENDQSLWILKPTSLNRGRGIYLFSTLKQLSKLLSESSFQISVKMYNENNKPKTYIIQEYIERPLLIEGYKFDMRMWVFLTIAKVNGKKILKTYLFQHGYSRLASVKYSMNQEDKQQSELLQKQNLERTNSPKKERKSYISNRFIHLTNNAVQKDSKEYGQYCEGNQLSLEDTIQYFQKIDAKCTLTFNGVIDRMKKIVGQSVDSVKQRLTSSNVTKTFQLMGYDFLLDQNYNLWLIEVNCNPCLQQSSVLLGRLLRQMLSGLIILAQLQAPKINFSSQGWIEIQ